MADFEKDLLTEKIIGCCFEVHKGLGPGFLDFFIENRVIVEIKSFAGIYTPVLFQKQVLS